jgi:hypothetical protein
VRRFALVALGLVLIGLAIVPALLAVDVHRWHHRMQADDLRYRLTPTSGTLWGVSAIVPWNAGRDLLGVRDDLAYREAVRAFWLGRARLPAYGQPRLIAYRAQAQALLTGLVDHDRNRARASAAENFLGVLAFVNAARDEALRESFLANGVAAFQNAVSLDPSSDDAKYNLELALSRLAAEQVAGRVKPGGTERGGSHGAGAGETGSGY